MNRVTLACLSLSPADFPLCISLSVCLSRWQMTAGATVGPPAPSEAPFAVLRGESPPPAIFQDRHAAVTSKTLAKRRGLSHKTSKASAAMKTQVRGALSVSTSLLLSDCSPPPLHTASTLFIHFSCCAVGDPKCTIYSAADVTKCLHIPELSVQKFYDTGLFKSLFDE